MTSKLKKRLKFFFIKLPIIFLIIMLVLIGALKMVARYPEPLKEGFEQFISEQTGTKATIGQVDKIAFHPDVHLEFQNITLHRANNAAIIDAQAERFFVSLPISGLFTRKGRINNLDIVNLRTEKNIITPFKLNIKKAKIIDQADDPSKARLSVTGKYADQPFSLSVDIKKDKKSYIMPSSVPFLVSLGAYKIGGRIEKNLLDVKLLDVVFEKNSQVSSPYDYLFVEGQIYRTDNPLACLYMQAGNDLSDCNQYLKEGNNTP